MLLVIEGIDKLGKTTAIQEVVDIYAKQNIKVHTFSDFCTSYGKEVKKIFLNMKTSNNARLELVRCARNDMITNLLDKLSLATEIVILDRFIFSTIVYQNINLSVFDMSTPELNIFWRYKSHMKILLATSRYINNSDDNLLLSRFEKRYRTEEVQNNFRKVLSTVAKKHYVEVLVDKFLTGKDIINVMRKSL